MRESRIPTVGAAFASGVFVLLGSAMLIGVPQGLAQGKNTIVTIGRAGSPVISSIKSGRPAKDGKAMVGEAKGGRPGGTRQDHKNAIKAALADVAAVVVDLGEVTPNEDDQLLAEAAREAGVTIILERVEAKKMGDLVGPVGVKADLVVMENRPGGRSSRLNIFSDQGFDLKDGKEETQEIQLNNNPPPGERARTEENFPRKVVEPPKPPQASRRDTSHAGVGPTVTKVQQILAQRPFASGAQNQDLITRQCVNTTACYEFESFRGPYTWTPPNATSLSSQYNLNISAGMYATATGKYVVMRTIGSVATRMTWDAHTNRGYFFEGVRSQFTPLDGAWTNTWLPPGFKLDRSAPGNDADTGSVSTSTGFTFGFQGTQPAASYSTSTTGTMSVPSWQVTNVSFAPIADWAWGLALVGSGTRYTSWTSLCLGDDEWSWTPGVHTLPTISRAGFGTSTTAGLTEVTYLGPANATGYFNWKHYGLATVRRTWVASNYWVAASWSSQASTYGWTTYWYFNLGAISATN